jgi:hypothetical protein
MILAGPWYVKKIVSRSFVRQLDRCLVRKPLLAILWQENQHPRVIPNPKKTTTMLKKTVSRSSVCQLDPCLARKTIVSDPVVGKSMPTSHPKPKKTATINQSLARKIKSRLEEENPRRNRSFHTSSESSLLSC